MMYTELALCAVAIIYLGQVLGLIYECANINYLKPIWQYSFTVPFVLLILCIAFLRDSLKMGNVKHFLKYLIIPQKSTIVMACYAKMYQNRKTATQKKKVHAPSVRCAAKIVKPILVAVAG